MAYTWPNLANGGAYRLRVKAQNSKGESMWSPWSPFVSPGKGKELKRRKTDEHRDLGRRLFLLVLVRLPVAVVPDKPDVPEIKAGDGCK